MSTNGNGIINPVTQDLPREQATELAKQAIRSAEAQGARGGFAGLKAMCLLSGLGDSPAVMPTRQAMSMVNSLRGNSNGHKSAGSNGNGKKHPASSVTSARHARSYR